MYGMSGPELLTKLKVSDTLANAERLHRASVVLKERNAARRMALNVSRFWRGAAARPVAAAEHEAAIAS